MSTIVPQWQWWETLLVSSTPLHLWNIFKICTPTPKLQIERYVQVWFMRLSFDIISTLLLLFTIVKNLNINFSVCSFHTCEIKYLIMKTMCTVASTHL